METNYQMIIKLDAYDFKSKGIINIKEGEYVRETLHLAEMDTLQLQNLRDFAVLYFTSELIANGITPEKKLKTMDKISGITHMIDLEIIRRGSDM